MDWQYTPYFFPLITGAAICIALAWFSWRHRSARGAISFAVLMCCVAWWSVGYALQLARTDLQAKIIHSNINYFAIFVVPLAWLIFALQYTGREKNLTRRNVMLLAIVPVLMTAVLWTNDLHHWFRQRVDLITIDDAFRVMEPTHGPAFWIYAAYAYALSLTGTFLLIQMPARSPGLYRGQAIAIIIGALTPLAGNAISIFDLIPLEGLDLTPFSFIVTGLALAWGLFRFQLLDVVPVARDTVIESMRDSVIVLDASKRIVDLNPAAQDLLGHPLSEVVGRPSRMVLSTWPELAEYAQDVVEALAEITLSEGATQRHFDLRISPLQGAGQRPMGQLIVLRDITARKRAEGELRAILESIADGVVVFDQNGKAVIANPAIEGLLGYSPDDIAGADIEELMGSNVDTADRQTIANALSGAGAPATLSVKIRWGDKTLSISVAPVRLGPGEEIGTVAVFRDFTREAEIDRMKSTFVAIASHDLRTPLTAIMGYAEMLHMGIYGSLEGEQNDVMRRIVANAKYMLSLANNLLDQAQMESGTLRFMITPLSPVDLLNEVMEAMEILAQSKGLELIGDFTDDLPDLISGDQQRLSQILINLISNAIKFTEKGSVRVRAYPSGTDRWAVATTDTGPGIPEEAQAHIFEPFRQADDPLAKRQYGAGLGLSIAKQLVELMGGEILLESTIGQGSTFTVVLPTNLGETPSPDPYA